MSDLALGIDLGTSGAKAIIAEPSVHGGERILARASRAVPVSSPRPGWSEQHPDLWRDTIDECLVELAAQHRALMGRVGGIGLSGQMLGAVLIDRSDRPVRPAILWNDQRSLRECDLLLERVPDIGWRTNGVPDPGLTAPKLLWLARHEPDAIDRADLLLLPKDQVRLWLTGERVSEPSDAGGTMLMECATGAWSAELCEAAGWSLDRLPPTVASWERAGTLRDALAERWSLPRGIPVAAGAGDNMACSLGVGVARPGRAAITIGTSAVVCAPSAAFCPAPDDAMLTAAHAAPSAFLSMAVVMSATASLDWVARLTGATVEELASEIDAWLDPTSMREAPTCLPALSGVRTPHNRPGVGGAIEGLSHRTSRAALGYAVMEGIACQIRECVRAQARLGLEPEEYVAVGGGATNPTWLTLIATLLDRPVRRPAHGPDAAALGAARLARLAADPSLEPGTVLGLPAAIDGTFDPKPEWSEPLGERWSNYENLTGYVTR